MIYIIPLIAYAGLGTFVIALINRYYRKHGITQQATFIEQVIFWPAMLLIFIVDGIKK